MAVAGVLLYQAQLIKFRWMEVSLNVMFQILLLKDFFFT